MRPFFILIVRRISYQADHFDFKYSYLIFPGNLNGLDTYKQKIAHLKSLYHLASVDNVITKAELVYIKNVAERLGVNLEELRNFSSAEPELDLPDKEYKLYSLFHRLVIIIIVDNEVTENEKTYCFNLGIKMGLHPNAIGEIMEYVISNGPMNALPQEITAIFRKYMS